MGVIPGASLMSWQFSLGPAEGQESIQLWGRHHFGLGMRFVESMDEGSEFVTAGNAEGVAVRGAEKLTRANWCALYGKAGDKPVTVAMFDAPANPRHPATWFTMNVPFAYLAATLNLHEQPLRVARSEPLTARYGIAIWDGKIGKSEIELAYQKWVELR